ncbi:MAG TPA: hypothetical protein VMU34_19065 [Mycobacterium sp.]|nr:hypothetical protein [Mycobacterium sp.]
MPALTRPRDLSGKLADGDVVLPDPRRVMFHPFERPDFYVLATSEAITAADCVRFDEHGKWYA